MTSVSPVASKTQRLFPPGPRGNLKNTISYARDAIGFTTRLVREYGDIVGFRLAGTPSILVSHPHYFKRVMQENTANYIRDAAVHKMVEPFLGRGLATVADHTAWRRNRRLIQPAFHQRKIEAFSVIMADTIEEMARNWERVAAAGEVINLGRHMSLLTLRVVVRCLFGGDIETAKINQFIAAVNASNDELGKYIRFPLIPLKFPTPGHRRFWRCIDQMNAIVYEFIEQLSQSGDAENRDGLLAMLMSAQDADTGERFTDKELRDEVFTMLFAGHETSATTLTWVWYELARRPEIAERVRDEAETVLSGRPAAISDLPQLTYTKQVINEVLRLYPPSWLNYRLTVADDEMGGYVIPAGSQVLLDMLHMHRHPDFWDEPEVFDPDRFTPEKVEARDRYAHIPFAVGGHQCIGNVFAMVEMQLAVATLVQRFELKIPADPVIRPKPLLTLSTDAPVMATPVRRS